MSKVVGASCQSYASKALGCEAGLSGEKGSNGDLAQLAYMVGRGCEGRKLHFGLGHIYIYVRVPQKLYGCIYFISSCERKKMTRCLGLMTLSKCQVHW